MPATESTTLNRQWLVKMLIPMVVLGVLGGWGLFDAMYAYPKRGMEDASYQQKLYLESAQEAGKLSKGEASIPDPQARLGVLAAKRDELNKSADAASRLQAQASGAGADAQQAAAQLRRLRGDLMDAAALRWLDSLAVVGRLDKTLTDMTDPATELKSLSEKWKTTSQPKPLSQFDLPLQWVITLVGFGGLAYMLFVVLLPSRRRVYQWDPVEKRLFLPGGKNVTPADIAEFDKRKWDKFFVFLHLKDTVGGGVEKLDLLKHTKLEGWVLEMERIAFPDSAPKAEAADPVASQAAAASAGEGKA